MKKHIPNLITGLNAASGRWLSLWRCMAKSDGPLVSL